MDFFKPKHPSSSQKPLLHHALNSVQTYFSAINFNIRIPMIPIPHQLSSITSPFASLSSSHDNNNNNNNNNNSRKEQICNNIAALSKAEIKKRMRGVPVYKVSNYSQDAFAVVSDYCPERETQFYFFNKQDAQDYFDSSFLKLSGQATDCQIFDVPLAEVVKLEDISVSPPIKLVPELSQIKNAIQESKKNDASWKKYFGGLFGDKTFSGVPLFQSDRLMLTHYGEDPCNCSEPSKFRLAYLRKEDLEKALAINEHPTDNIQVAALEDVIQEMRDRSSSKWNDTIFVAPGTTSWTWFGY